MFPCTDLHVCLSALPLTGTWVISSLGLLRMQLLFCVSVLLGVGFPFSRVSTSSGGIAGSCGKYMFNFIRSCQVVFRSDCHPTVPPAEYEGDLIHLTYNLGPLQSCPSV